MAVGDGSRARYKAKETPTRPSLQAVRIAEEERMALGEGARHDAAESGVIEAAARVDVDPVSDIRPRRVDAPKSAGKLEVSQVARRIEKLTPRMLVSMRDISKYPIDPRAAFLLGYVDGSLAVEEIADLCGMPTADASELVDRLQRLGVLALA